MHSYHVPT